MLKKEKTHKVIFTAIIITAIVLSFAFTGCGKQSSETTTSKIDVEQTSTTEEIAGDTTETTKKSVENMQITGNINILTGMEIKDGVLDTRPFAIMINNHPDARPQTGLGEADVLIEVVDEGGITRMIGVYSSQNTDIVGPIRSARQYYAELARMFDPVYVFWGTYPEGYKLVQNMDMDVLTPLGDTSGASSITANMSDGTDAWRDNSRVAPHNAYSSNQKLIDAAIRNGYSVEGGQSPFAFKLDASQEKKGTVKDIKIDFSVASFAAGFSYNEEKNQYEKSTGGNPDNDKETGETLMFNNVIALITDIANSGDSSGHMIVRTTGSGKAFFFFDGNVIEGQWGRTSILDPMEFTDENGDIILVNRGSTYIGMVQGTDRVIY